MKYQRGVLCDDDLEVVDVAWVPLDDVSSRLAYRDERRLVAKARGMLGDIW
jgi:hypothetical protein